MQEQLGAGTAWRSRLLKSSGYRFKRNSSAVVVLCVCGVVLGGSLKVRFRLVLKGSSWICGYQVTLVCPVEDGDKVTAAYCS